MDRAGRRGVIVICLMLLSFKIVNYQFYMMDPVDRCFYNYSQRYFPGATYPAAGFFPDGLYPWEKYFLSPASWIYSARYLLPVLGGLLSSYWFGYVRVLQMGGAVMLLSTVLMSVLATVSPISFSCSDPLALVIFIAWLPLPVFFGLIQPNILYGMFRWITQNGNGMFLFPLYYMIDAIGDGIATIIPIYPVLMIVPSSLLLVVFTPLLPKEAMSSEPFLIPRRPRLKIYFRIFSGVILFLIATVPDTQDAVQISEMRFFLGGTPQNGTDLDWKIYNLRSLPRLLDSIYPIIFSLLLVLIAGHAPRRLSSVQSRMLAGVLVEAAAALTLTAYTGITCGCDVSRAITVFTVTSVLDSTAEALVITANYEIACGISPPNSKSFVIGIMLTVWAFPYIVSNLMLLVLNSGAIKLSPLPGDDPRFWIFHLTALIALIICLIYLKFSALPLALRLMESTRHDYPETADDLPINEESRPLLALTDQQSRQNTAM